jgi:hypothetical protein
MVHTANIPARLVDTHVLLTVWPSGAVRLLLFLEKMDSTGPASLYKHSSNFTMGSEKGKNAMRADFFFPYSRLGTMFIGCVDIFFQMAFY